MDIFQATLLGLVEGVTEFLPISSTFHLIFFSQLLGIEQTDFVKLFEVFIQAGGILAVAVLYGRRIITDWELNKKIAVSFVPTAIVGFGLHKIIKTIFFESSALMLSAFIIVGLVFIIYERWLRSGQVEQVLGGKSSVFFRLPTKNLSDLTYRQAVIIGLLQALAVVPGVSRAGAVLVGMMLMGTKRSQAAEYSFLLAVPTIGAAAFLDVVQMRASLAQDMSQLLPLAVGFGVSFVTALLVLKWLIKYLQHHSLESFGWYRLVAAAGLLLWLGL